MANLTPEMRETVAMKKKIRELSDSFSEMFSQISAVGDKTLIIRCRGYLANDAAAKVFVDFAKSYSSQVSYVDLRMESGKKYLQAVWSFSEHQDYPEIKCGSIECVDNSDMFAPIIKLSSLSGNEYIKGVTELVRAFVREHQTNQQAFLRNLRDAAQQMEDGSERVGNAVAAIASYKEPLPYI